MAGEVPAYLTVWKQVALLYAAWNEGKELGKGKRKGRRAVENPG